MAEDFPENVRQFLAERISSVAQLEVLLLLKSDPQRQWTAGEASKALYTTPDMATGQLEELRARGLLAATGESAMRYQYRPASPELAAQVVQLEQTYQERRVAVITAIYSQPLDKVRTFADAFRLRKDK